VEELEAADFACGDRVVFFTQVVVDSSATDTNQTIFIQYDFSAVNVGQQGVGYSDILAAGISDTGFPPASQSGESGNINLDGNEAVTLVSESFRPAGSTFGAPNEADRAQHLDATVKVAGLDPGDEIIVRVDVRFSCFAPDPTGNLHAAISGASFDEDGDGAYPDADDPRVNVGEQDITMKGLGDVVTPTPTPTASPTPTPTAPPTPTPTATSSPTPTPTASPTPTPTQTPGPTPTPTATPSPTPSPTPVVTATPTASASPTPTAIPATETPSPTASPTATPAPSASPTPTAIPATGTPSPTASPTIVASPTPTAAAAVAGPGSLPAGGGRAGSDSGRTAATILVALAVLAGLSATVVYGRRARDG
jgi:hypothetical protein